MENLNPVLSINDLNAWYGESHVLHGINIKMYHGETIAILGRNGVGKTTTLRAIIGVIRKRTGSIIFKGNDLLNRSLHQVAKLGIGYVPEERAIFSSLSVEENLLLPPIIAKGGMSTAEIYDLFPNLKERRNSGGTQLSGGEQQMLAIARILRTGVDVILLDEPTEGLAPVIVKRIREVLLELKKRGMTIMLVEQNFRFASSFADRFYLVDHGKIIANFHASQLEEHQSIIREVLGV